MIDDLPIWESLFEGGSPESGWIHLQWSLLQKRSRTLLLLPRSIKAATRGLKLYPAQRGSARLAKRAINYLVKSPLAGSLPQVNLRVRDTADLVGMIARLTGVTAARTVTPAILCGNQHPARQRFAIMAFDDGCEPAAVIKAAVAREGRELVLREAAFLAGIPAAVPGIVRLREQLNLPHLAAMGLVYCPGEVPDNADRLPDLLQAWIQPTAPLELRGFQPWAALAESAGPRPLFKALEARLDKIQIRPVIQHGDFTPGNIRVSPSGDWTAIDWENGSREGLPAWDWFHYVCQTAILVRRLPEDRLVAQLEALLQTDAFLRYASSAGIRDFIRPWLLAYLLHQNYVVWPAEGFQTGVHLLGTLAARWGFPSAGALPGGKPEIQTTGDNTPAPGLPGGIKQEPQAPRRLRVLISAFACNPDWGAEAEIGWHWALEMARFHEVTVLTRRVHQSAIERELLRISGRPLPGFLYHEEPQAAWVEDWFSASRVYYVLWQRSARRRVAQWVEEGRFDLLHHATIGTYRFPTAIWGHGVPCVWGPIGGAESIPARLLPWAHPRPLAYEIARNIDNFLQTSTLGVMVQRARRSTAILVATPRTEAVFRELGCTPFPMPAIGVHARSAQTPRLARPHGALRLLFLGRFAADRGIDLLLEALRASGTNAELALVGEGPFRWEIERLISKFSLAEQVKVIRNPARSPGFPNYSAHDVFVFPSLHGGSSHGVVEAMSQAMPVICLAVGWISQAVAEDCGIPVPLGSRREVVAALAEAIRTFDGDRDLVLQRGRRAQQVAASQFGWKARGIMMDRIYRHAAATHPKSP